MIFTAQLMGSSTHTSTFDFRGIHLDHYDASLSHGLTKWHRFSTVVLSGAQASSHSLLRRI
jgi:hypothetical protein